MMKLNEREQLMKKLQEAAFAVYDVQLYLDTHPTDQAALRYFDQQRQAKQKAMEEYAAKYGPVRVEQSSRERKWNWIEDPWPWEMED